MSDPKLSQATEADFARGIADAAANRGKRKETSSWVYAVAGYLLGRRLSK